MRFFAPLALTTCLVLPLAAHADTVQSFAYNATYADGSIGSGGILVDTTAGSITDVDITITQPAGGGVTFAATQGTFFQGDATYEPSGVMYYGFYVVNGSSNIEINFPLTSLVGYAGGEICALDYNNCPTGDGSYLLSSVTIAGDPFAASGSTVPGPFSAAPASVTPEPSTWLLLATGMCGLMGATRRRFTT